MTRYTLERGYGLDLSGPEPVWRGKKRRWNRRFASASFVKSQSKHARRIGLIRIDHQGLPVWVPRYRIDDYIKRGLIDPARRDDL